MKKMGPISIFPENLPEFASLPLVADMSSNILAVDYDVSKFGLIYAGAQKNLGIAGLTIVIIREDLLNEAESLSSMMDYQILVENGSMYNKSARWRKKTRRNESEKSSIVV